MTMDSNAHFKYTPSVWLVPSLFLLVMWMVYFSEEFFNISFANLGVYPRTIGGAKGIVLSPFLHGDSQHLANNSVPFFILTAALIYFYRTISLKVLVYGILLSGLITWVIGRNAYHIGASGLVYVLVSFIFFKGLMTKYYRLIALSLTVVVIYGGMIWYVFPDVDKTISWEGHLGGLITGYIFAVRFKTPDYQKELQFEWQLPDYNPEDDKFMQRFDGNGNFVNLPEPEPEPEILSSDYNVFYEFKPNKEEDQNLKN